MNTAALRRRRGRVAATYLAGTGLLGASLSTTPGSPRFYGLTLGVAVTWVAGAVGARTLHRGRAARAAVVTPALIGVGAFGMFYGCALVARNIPMLDRAITKILAYDHRGSSALVLGTTLVNGAAEELFFRGALYTAVRDRHPVVTSTVLYSLTTTATRNPALVIASTVMGTIFALQRRATGGIQAPMITHLTWSALMLRYLPPLFRDHSPAGLVTPTLGRGTRE